MPLLEWLQPVGPLLGPSPHVAALLFGAWLGCTHALPPLLPDLELERLEGCVSPVPPLQTNPLCCAFPSYSFAATGLALFMVLVPVLVQNLLQILVPMVKAWFKV